MKWGIIATWEMALKGVVRVSNGLDKGMFSAVCMNNKGGRMRMELIKE